MKLPEIPFQGTLGVVPVSPLPEQATFQRIKLVHGCFARTTSKHGVSDNFRVADTPSGAQSARYVYGFKVVSAVTAA